VASTLRAVVAANVRAERIRRGLTQRELATMLKWSEQTIRRIEHADRPVTLDELPYLLRALGVGLDRLLLDLSATDAEALYPPRR
jgi:transcriptional regulator with XRE-family HTH domain